MKKLPLLTAALGLCLTAGCSRTPNTINLADDANGMAGNGTYVVPPDDGLTAEGTDEVVEVAAVPTPTAGLAPADAAPLTEAADLSRRIRQGGGIERVPYEGGWGWRENGQIVRTSSRDGRRVSYFRPGTSTPYLVQQDDRAFAYSGGRVERGYDGRGRPVEVDRTRRDEGERLARESAEERSRATRVATEQPDRIRRERPAMERRDDARQERGTNVSRDSDRDRGPETNTSGRRDPRPGGADGDSRSRPDRNDRRTGNEMTPRTH